MAEGWRAVALAAARRAGLEPSLRAAQRAVGMRSHLGRRNLRDEAHMNLLMRLTLPVDADCVDVGANVGQLLEVMVAAAPRGRHIAFEPLPEHAAALAARFPSVDVRNVALSDEPGTLAFFRVKGASTRSSLGSAHLAGYETEQLDVEVQRLDDALTDGFVPALIKLDVEGAEVRALRGARETLAAHHPILIIEHGMDAAASFDTTPGDLHELLAGVGYRLFDIDGHGPFDRRAFEEVVRRGRVWTFVAHV